MEENKYVPHSEEEANENDEMLLETIIEEITAEAHEEEMSGEFLEQLVEKEAEEITQAILENVPAEKQEEILSEVQKLVRGDEKLETLRTKVWAHFKQKPFTAQPRAHSLKNRGVGITRKSHAKTPAQRLASKISRRINRGK